MGICATEEYFADGLNSYNVLSRRMAREKNSCELVIPLMASPGHESCLRFPIHLSSHSLDVNAIASLFFIFYLLSLLNFLLLLSAFVFAQLRFLFNIIFLLFCCFHSVALFSIRLDGRYSTGADVLLYINDKLWNRV